MPISAITLSCNQIQKLSPWLPSVFFLGVRFVELLKYSNKLIKKREIIVFNKIDMISDEEVNKKINTFSKKIKKKIYSISALKHKGLATIKRMLVNYVH